MFVQKVCCVVAVALIVRPGASQFNPNYRILPYNLNEQQIHQYPQSHGKPRREDTFDLKQVNADELPPGEYEILAMFDSNDKKVGQDPPQQQSRYENSKSISYQYDPNQVEYVRPPGSIFEGYNRKPNTASQIPLTPYTSFPKLPSGQGLPVSYASQNIQHRPNTEQYSQEDDYYDDNRAVYYKPPHNTVSDVKSLPRREQAPILENKFHHFAPVHQSTTEQSFTTLNSISYNHHKQDNLYHVTPTPKPYPTITPSNPRITIHVPADHDYEQPFIHGDPRQPVKKAANRYPFRFPDDPQLQPQAFAPTPIPPTVTPVVNYRQPEPDFIYQPEELLPTPQTPVKRKIISRPEENRSQVPETLESIDQQISTNPNRKVPRVIDSNKARNPLERLKEIAGDASKNPVSPIGIAKPKDPADDFKCPYDGHFGDPKDCTKFYRCAHGTALPDYCPGDLYWNTATEQCDWPEETTCQFDPNNPEIKSIDQPTFVYLTFDDGPNEGTDSVLNALESEGVRATFFINSQNLYEPKRENAERNARSLLRVVDSGHTLADHSFNHMSHNNENSPVNAYMNVERDLNYFGASNINPVLDLLWGNDRRDERLLHYVNTTMMGLVRMPYSNNWRVPEAKIHADCGSCTTPTTSGQRGIEIANRLSSEGRYVIGWDLEWAMDFNANRNQYGGSVAYTKLRTRHTKSPRKVVLLCHDAAFRPGGARNEENELKTFLQLAKKSGYTFRTMDTYVTDNVNA